MSRQERPSQCHWHSGHRNTQCECGHGWCNQTWNSCPQCNGTGRENMNNEWFEQATRQR